MSRFQHIAPEPIPAEGPSTAGPSAVGGDHASSAGVADPAAAFLEQADRALGRGDFERALRHYGRALEHDRARPAAWLGQVRALIAMGQSEEAATWLEQAGRILGEQPALLALRAVTAARLGKIEDARAWSDRALRDGPDDPEVWLARAEVTWAGGNGRIAAMNLDKAHERAPGPATARRAGEVALQAGDLSLARRWLETAQRGDPENPLVALRLGVLWERTGDLERARHELSRALSLDPACSSARLALDDLDSRSPWSRLSSRILRWSRS